MSGDLRDDIKEPTDDTIATQEPTVEVEVD